MREARGQAAAALRPAGRRRYRARRRCRDVRLSRAILSGAGRARRPRQEARPVGNRHGGGPGPDRADRRQGPAGPGREAALLFLRRAPSGPALPLYEGPRQVSAALPWDKWFWTDYEA